MAISIANKMVLKVFDKIAKLIYALAAFTFALSKLVEAF